MLGAGEGVGAGKVDVVVLERGESCEEFVGDGEDDAELALSEGDLVLGERIIQQRGKGPCWFVDDA